MKTTEIIEKNKSAVILLDIIQPKENNQSTISIRGTGFLISPDGKFITCAHVYKLIQENELQYLAVSVPGKTDAKGIMGYERYKTSLISIDEENDVALMQIISDKKDFPVVELGNSDDIKEGEELLFLGYPLATELLGLRFGITMNANHCIVGSVKKRSQDGSFHFFMVDTHVNNGSSGSPVFLKDSGKVMGIASGKISSSVQTPDGKAFDIPANMGICRPINYAKKMVNN